MPRGRVRVTGLLAALAVCAGLASGARAAPSEANEEVAQVEARWARALVAADLEALDAIYADDLVYIHSNGSIETKQQFLDSIATGRLRFRTVTLRDSQVRLYGNSAVVSALYDLGLEVGGGSVTMSIQYMTVYVGEPGAWRIVAQQTTRLPGASQ